jgi:hypothetical protein
MPEGEGVVAYGEIDGEGVIGVNSSARGYRDVDRAAANEMRDVLVREYPKVMKTVNIGQKPNDALFHAEATILLRAARQNGGTLSGRVFEVQIDRRLCDSCETVLPLLGGKLGNPTVTYIGPKGERHILSNGVLRKVE